MKTIKISGLTLLQFSTANPDWPLRHAVSTRIGGVSEGNYSHLNVALHVGDTVKAVTTNRRMVCAAIAAPTDHFVAMKQSHTANVSVISGRTLFNGLDCQDGALANVDAVVTNVKGLTLFAMAADCAMLLLYDERKCVLSLIHAGWRGAALNIVKNTINAMRLEYGTNPKNLFAGIAPTICGDHYTVPRSRIQSIFRIYGGEIARTFISWNRRGFHMDIRSILHFQLKSLGVEHIEVSSLCTTENMGLLYSARGSAGPTGRFGMFAHLAN